MSKHYSWQVRENLPVANSVEHDTADVKRGKY